MSRQQPLFCFDPKKLPKKSPYGNKCGSCGKPVKVTATTMKCDLWHWHPQCWKKFLRG